MMHSRVTDMAVIRGMKLQGLQAINTLNLSCFTQLCKKTQLINSLFGLNTTGNERQVIIVSICLKQNMLYVVSDMSVLNTHCTHKFMHSITQQGFCGNGILLVEIHADLACVPVPCWMKVFNHTEIARRSLINGWDEWV